MAPAATVTLDDTVAIEVLLLASVTAAPPTGAAALSVTFPVDEVPPTTKIGFTSTDDKAMPGGITVSTVV